jgi:tRNA threonylcarbamoyladenosine biosynthesis protein TsaE
MSLSRQNPVNRVFELKDEQAMIAFGHQLSCCINALNKPILIILNGDLGVGKTTLSRGILQGLGHTGAVKSPTYTLVEPYDLTIGKVYHFDLYRLVDPQELEAIGFTDYLSEAQLCMIEWPENGDGFIPQPDLAINISQLPNGRCLSIGAMSHNGENCLQQLQLRGEK